MTHSNDTCELAVIVPCYNEALTIGTVITDIRSSLPDATLYVYDNNSTDDTAQIARDLGAEVRFEERQGKGWVVQRAFADIDADVYLMIDGDDTYDATRAAGLVDKLLSGPYDHVVGVRNSATGQNEHRRGHAFGNNAFNTIVSKLFNQPVYDMLSGYRAFSRRFVKSFPAQSAEFEIETELTIHALTVGVPAATVDIGFKKRPEGSESKLRTFRDGRRILGMVLNLVRHERPILFYNTIGFLLTLISAILIIPVISGYLDTGQVPRFPSLIAGGAILTIASLTFMAGIIVDSTRRNRRQSARLTYLSLAPPPYVPVPTA